MGLPQNVKKKKGLWKLLPRVYWEGTSSAFYTNIYLAPKIWDGVHKNPPDHYSVGVLIHDQEHIKRQRKKGYLKWSLLYLISSKFRIEEEFAATKPQFKYLKSKDTKMDLEWRAERLASYIYLWGISKGEALKSLKKLWKEA